MAAKRITVSERFHLEKVPQDIKLYGEGLRENEDYLLSAQELIDTDHEGERIYQMIFPITRVELSGEGITGNVNPVFTGTDDRKEKTGTAGASGANETEDPGAEGTSDTDGGTEPAEPADEGGILVYADGIRIGRIKGTDSLHLKNLYQNYKISGLEADVHGGPYRTVVQGSEDEPVSSEGEARWSAVLTVYYRVPRNAAEITSDLVSREQVAAMVAALTAGAEQGAGISRTNTAASSGWPGSDTAGRAASAPSETAAADRPAEEDSPEERWGIDTSYETVRKEKDPAGRGMIFLLIAAVYSMFYLCFSVPGWIPSLSAGRSAINLFGFTVNGLPGYVPGAVMIAGLLCNIIAMFTGGGIVPLAAAFLYLLAGFIAPGCILFTAIPAVLCILGALCKKKGNTALRVILALAAGAIAAFLLYQHFSGKVLYSPFQNRDLTDWPSFMSFVKGELPENTVDYETTGGGGFDEDGVYVEDDSYEDGEVYYEDESDWLEEETDWWEDESDWWEEEIVEWEDETGEWEDESEVLIWEEETETETEQENGNGQFGQSGEAGLL